jgi:hypothetical protein
VAQSGKRSVSSSEGVVRWEATPELVNLDFTEAILRDQDHENR